MPRFLPFVLILLSGGITLTFGQADIRKTTQGTPSGVSSPVPVVFGRKDDGFPETMTVTGVIKDLTFIKAGCGGVAWAGTLRLELKEKVSNSPPKDVFVVVGCFPDFEKFGSNRKSYLNKPVRLTVSKLYPDLRFSSIIAAGRDVLKVPCAFDLITNEINSKGIPFYCTSENISESIEASLSIKGRQQLRD